jgi:2-polyprenyl-6-methoxyphenol hydroxylase-like FAD-dependent oxidoreductase
MAIEDAYVLAGLLARPECRTENVEAFLDAYEEVRRPRSYKQLLHACETGEVRSISLREYIW